MRVFWVILWLGSLSLATAPARDADVIARLALVSDPHSSVDPRDAQYNINYAAVIEQVNAAGVDAVLISGDVTQTLNKGNAAKFLELSSAFTAKRISVAGNHDAGQRAIGDKKSTITAGRLATYQRELGPLYFAEMATPQVRVVGITSPLIGSGLPAEAEQMAFLERELAEPKPGVTLLLTHFPPFFGKPDEADDYFNMPTASRGPLLSLLKRGKVNAILSGHLHRPIELDWEGIPIVGAPAVSFGLPRDKQPVGWRLVDVHRDGRITSTPMYLESAAAPSTTPAAGGSMIAPSPMSDADVSERVHIFYYDWYGAPPQQEKFVHWQQGQRSPPEDIGSNYYPQLGPYSSGDPKVLQQHMAWIRQSGAGVLVVTWWGKGSYEDRRIGPIMDAAAAAGLKVAFHLEPYSADAAKNLADDVAYITERYGKHAAYYRKDGRSAMFYIFETVTRPVEEWKASADKVHAVDANVLLIAQTSNLDLIRRGGFDGGYPYDGLAPFKDPAFLESWKTMVAADFAKAGKLFIPSVGPGYWDDRAVPTKGASEPPMATTRDDGNDTTYAAAWQAAIDCGAPIISITSFNEWHEGSQIEPAVAKTIEGYSYPAYKNGADHYLKLTAEWVKKFEAARADKPKPR